MGVLTLRIKRPALVAFVCAIFPIFGDPAFGQGMVWGIGGHPTWADYAGWVPGNTATELGYVRELGCTYYRCSFEGAAYPAILQTVVPQAAALGITVLPDLPLTIVPNVSAQTNYQANYKVANAWATYAISKHDVIPNWEIGNELENWDLIKVTYDGTSANDFPDKTPGGFVAMASALNGAYHGVRDAYAAGRKAGETTITPNVLFGCTYHHWGLLAKLQKDLGSLPCDAISWHWYEPNSGSFTAAIHDPKSASNNRTPAECLADFKSKTNPGQPMDVWITELNRSVKGKAAQDYLNGSVSPTAAGGQDWAAQASTITTAIDNVKSANTVKAIFVYELFDETRFNGSNPKRLHDEGYFGLMTGLGGTYKDAFHAYQTEIKGGASSPN